ncbi:MAG: zinc-ribbon domain-containing protein [Bifidobacterium longum]
MKCQVCGTEMPEGSRFCTECGAPMAQSAPSPSPQSMDGPTLVPAAPQQVPAGSMPLPITMFGRPRWSGPGRRFRYDFPALSSMIRGGCCRRERGRPMTADRNQAGYTDASGAHGAGLVVMWVRRGRPDSSEPAAAGKPS